MKTFTPRNESKVQSLGLRRHARRKCERPGHNAQGCEESGTHPTSRESPIFRILPGI